VVVNVSRYRCDALILASGRLQAVPLPWLSLAAAVRETVQFHSVLHGLGRAADSGQLARMAAERALAGSLGWLWDTVAAPVLTALGLTGPPAPGKPWPRLWWVPAGPLAFLPLHAAGRQASSAAQTPSAASPAPGADAPVPPGSQPSAGPPAHDRGGFPTAGGGKSSAIMGEGESVLDRVVPSYAVSVAALGRARAGGRASAERVPVVAVPEAPGAPELPGAAREAGAVAALFPGATRLTGAAATRAAVLGALGGHGWLHFCGHGRADPDSPSASELILHDYAANPLTVAGLSRLDLDGAELAYLSACTTALGGFGLADEALHLAGAVQLAGFRHVIGTLWAIDDTVAADLAGRIYAGLGAPVPDARRAAASVHAAVCAVRDRYPAFPLLWASHIHVGA